ncbi:hypothetical protein ABEB36_003480 [Hypothenemus hampei]|uniref:AB hydrolase-1 domain-containing protein n=1 Tax=Hypothenemus hampei TaxID=57062 RepID=A0ABD1F9Q5_HYPHA
MLSLQFQTFAVFIPINSPRSADFNQPEDTGLRGIYNFYLKTRDYHYNSSVNIGAWLILPEDMINLTTSNDVEEILRTTQRDIVIYLHGVSANRAKAWAQYEVLRKHFMILAVDHRGYGDSGKNVPMTELGIAHDHVQIYDWVKKLNTKSDVYYWGHSLGSALSAHTLRLLKEQNKETPKGLVLESSFTTLQDVIINVFVGKLYSWLAYFDATILTPLDANGFHFRSKEHILSIDCPVMLLHSEDDMVVRYPLGVQLAKIASENRKNDQGKVIFHGISADYGFGHNDIIRHPAIDNFITDFKEVCRNFTHNL